MADIVDAATSIVEEHLARGLRATRAAVDAMPAGMAGECEMCGDEMPRLVGGRCAPCRDRRQRYARR